MEQQEATVAQVLMILASILAILAGAITTGPGRAPQVALAGPAGPGGGATGLEGTAVPASQALGQTMQASFVPPQAAGPGPGGTIADPGTTGRVVAEGPASHYLGPDDNRPVNPLTGGKVEQAAQSGFMVDGTMPTAAMKNVPLGTKVRVTNLGNGASIIVRINDRGPYVGNRVIDLTYGAFTRIANPNQGVIPAVRVEALPPETPTTWPEQLLTSNDWNRISASAA